MKTYAYTKLFSYKNISFFDTKLIRVGNTVKRNGAQNGKNSL